MSRYVLFTTLVGLLPACSGDTEDFPLPSEGEGDVNGAEGEGEDAEGEGSPDEGEGVVGEGEGEGAEGEGEGPVCACASDAACDDGNFCNGIETCDCACQPGTPPTCADEFECTEDRCADNRCVNVPAHARCGDGKICRPAEGGCVAPPPCRDDADCVPDDPCQTGNCEAATRSCAFAPFDGDEDGHAPIVCGGDDCDDSTDAVNPEQFERCNQKDDNCDGEMDEGIDFMTSQGHCGGCNHECREWLRCVNGNCQCPSEGLTDCGSGCVNLQANRTNCGECGWECQEGEQCVAGRCVCPDGLENCGNGCIDTQADRENCGRCGHWCGDANGFILTCRGGECVCWEENQELCDDGCTVVAEDPENCGRCENMCDENMVCQNGTCICSEGFTDCNDICADLTADAAHCGRCGNECRWDMVCLDSNCACPEGTVDCNEQCVDTQQNCGRCGNECPFGSECQNGECGDCEQDWQTGRQCNGDCVVCDGMADVLGVDRVCSLTATDEYNCGRCGNQCDALGSECYEGRCECSWTWNDERCGNACVICDGMADLAGVDSACVLAAADEMNCGQCGNRCVPPAQCSQWGCH